MENEFPKSLYKDGSEFEWDGRPTDCLIVDSVDEQEAAEGRGWAEAAAYLSSSPSEKTGLDRNAADIILELPDLTLEELEKLKADEITGKTRKGLLAAIEGAIDEKLKG
jgi:hypothetical protein